MTPRPYQIAPRYQTSSCNIRHWLTCALTANAIHSLQGYMLWAIGPSVIFVIEIVRHLIYEQGVSNILYRNFLSFYMMSNWAVGNVSYLWLVMFLICASCQPGKCAFFIKDKHFMSSLFKQALLQIYLLFKLKLHTWDLICCPKKNCFKQHDCVFMFQLECFCTAGKAKRSRDPSVASPPQQRKPNLVVCKTFTF